MIRYNTANCGPRRERRGDEQRRRPPLPPTKLSASGNGTWATWKRLFAAELQERQRRAVERRVKDTRLTGLKTLDEFDFRRASSVLPARKRSCGKWQCTCLWVSTLPLTTCP